MRSGLKIISLSVLALGLWTGFAQAASDGSLGQTSVGTIRITLTIPKKAEVPNPTVMPLSTTRTGQWGTATRCIRSAGEGNTLVAATETQENQAKVVSRAVGSCGRHGVAYKVSYRAQKAETGGSVSLVLRPE